MEQVEQIAAANGANRVVRIILQIGPLSGVEGELLEQAFPIASAGTLAENSALEIHPRPVRVRCNSCGAESTAAANRLLCATCGDWQTTLISGDELLLQSVELEKRAVPS